MLVIPVYPNSLVSHPVNNYTPSRNYTRQTRYTRSIPGITTIKRPYSPSITGMDVPISQFESQQIKDQDKKKSENMSLPWRRLIRFIATDGRTLRGEPILPTPTTDLGFITESDKLQARVIKGDDLYDTTGKTRVTDEIVSVKTVLGPLAQADVPILRCVGLNYAKHGRFRYPMSRKINTPKDSYLYIHPPCLQSKKPAAPHPHSHSSSLSQTPQSTTTAHQ